MPKNPDGSYREPTNADRANWARHGIEGYVLAGAGKPSIKTKKQARDYIEIECWETVLSDLLCDLMHYADARADGDQEDGEGEFDEAIGRARSNYYAEIEGRE